MAKSNESLHANITEFLETLLKKSRSFKLVDELVDHNDIKYVCSAGHGGAHL